MQVARDKIERLESSRVKERKEFAQYAEENET
jgi:hypothetical protein